jgi:hypothetical protein
LDSTYGGLAVLLSCCFLPCCVPMLDIVCTVSFLNTVICRPNTSPVLSAAWPAIDLLVQAGHAWAYKSGLTGSRNLVSMSRRGSPTLPAATESPHLGHKLERLAPSLIDRISPYSSLSDQQRALRMNDKQYHPSTGRDRRAISASRPPTLADDFRCGVCNKTYSRHTLHICLQSD